MMRHELRIGFWVLLTGLTLNVCYVQSGESLNKAPIVVVEGGTGETGHVKTKDLAVVDDAFLHGYEHNRITDSFGGGTFDVLAIQCITDGKHQRSNDPGRWYSCWTRDLYWGFLGWVQAGDDAVLRRMRSSLDALRTCLKFNIAHGLNKTWPLNDSRHYIPQAFCKGGEIATDFFPYDSESQADFLLLMWEYWNQTHDLEYIRGSWPDLAYVTETIEKMDTNENGLPDQLWGSYDYQGLGLDTEEPLMCAKAAAAYHAVAGMAYALGKPSEATRLEHLAEKIRVTMNKPTTAGGLWLAKGGYYVNQRNIKKNSVDERFIPYENLVPLFLGVPTAEQTKAIFPKLDASYGQIYPLKWGPEYTAPAAHNEKSVMNCSSTVWLGFLDVYLRSRLDGGTNSAPIFKLLIEHAYDLPAGPFTEGAGIFGHLTGGAGRAWDNGNFFHCLIVGLYGVEKSAEGIRIAPPVKLEGFPLTELRNLHWRGASYDIEWSGQGGRIAEVLLDGQPIKLTNGTCLLTAKSGRHTVTIRLTLTTPFLRSVASARGGN
jgi:hypothetical protein